MSVRAIATLAVGGSLLLGGCGGGGTRTSTVSVAAPEPRAEYGQLTAAVERANVPLCRTEEGRDYIALLPPSASAAREYTYFQYLEGRIYEFGPCQLPSGKRNELRIYRYPGADVRDAGLRDVSKRGTRPTSTFAVGDEFAVEIWSPDPSLESPAGQAAAQVHSAISRVPLARHLDVDEG